MKTLLYIILGIALGIGCITCAISSVSALIHLSFSPCIINGLMAILFGYIAKKCFGKI